MDNVMLVTGATGTVGREVVHHLLQSGQQVRVLVRDVANAASFGARRRSRRCRSPGSTDTVTGVRRRAKSVSVGGLPRPGYGKDGDQRVHRGRQLASSHSYPERSPVASCSANVALPARVFTHARQPTNRFAARALRAFGLRLPLTPSTGAAWGRHSIRGDAGHAPNRRRAGVVGAAPAPQRVIGSTSCQGQGPVHVCSLEEQSGRRHHGKPGAESVLEDITMGGCWAR